MARSPTTDAAELRRHAEERLKQLQVAAPVNEAETQKLLHELQIQKIELEMQIQELRYAETIANATLTRYTDVYDFAPVGYFTLAFDGAIHMANLTGAAMLAPERSKLIGQCLGSFVCAESLPSLKIFLHEAFLIHKAGPQKIECELTLADKNGSRRYAHIEGFSAEGEGECRTAMTDVTERKNVEDALKRESCRNQTLMHLASDGIHIMDINGNILQANEAFCRMLGYSPEEMQTMNVAQWDAQWSGEELKEKLGQFIKQGTVWIFDTRHRCCDGRVIDVEISTVVVEINGEPVIYASSRDIAERMKYESALKLESYKHETLLRTASDGIHIFDHNGNMVEVNDAFCRMLGYSREEMLAMNVAQWDAQWSAAELMAGIAKLASSNPVFETRHRRCDGSIIDVEISASRVEIGGKQLIYNSARDITERKLAEAKINKINRALNVLTICNRVTQRAQEESELLHETCRIIVENGGYRFAWVGYVEHVPEKTVRPVAHAGYEAGYLEAVNITWEDSERGQDPAGTAIRSGQPSAIRDICTNTAFTPWKKDTIERGYSSVIALPLRVEGQIIGALNIYSAEADAFDSDEVDLLAQLADDLAFGISFQRQRAIQKNAEKLIWQQANFDSLTGLPNRRMFYDRLEQEIRKSSRAGLPLALMFLDLDRFKEINDTLGHDMGDLLLEEAARRLSSCVRASDTVARLGGDEFTVIMGSLDELSSIERAANDILQKLAEPFRLEDETAYISTSIGITLFPEDATDVEALLTNADQAMYAAKHHGRNRYHYFTPFMQKAAQVRMQISNDMRGALADNQFRVYYQPIVELATGAIHKAEALIRWQHPKHGLISPDAFIPIAEETGMINDIGNWVFHEAALQAERWRTSQQVAFQISVNKSTVEFHNTDAKYESWLDHLQKLGLPGQSVVVEITEGLLLNVSDATNDKLIAFRDAGMQVSLDDFGTGYSSLSYLKKFDIDYLKIDQSFVKNLVPDSDDMALCEAIIVMAHKLGIKVIAEGIETAEQRDLLTAAGCDYGQGFLFSRPVPPEEFEALLKTR